MQLIDRITPVENNSGSGGLHNEEDYVRDPPLTWNNNVMNNTSLGLLSKAELGGQPTGSWSNDMS